MTISYPLALPSTSTPRALSWAPVSVVGVSRSPFTLSEQVQVYDGEMWQIKVSLPPMARADAEVWVAWRLALRGRLGTFTMGDITGAVPRGTLDGSGVLVNGNHLARARTLNLKGLTAGATVKAGDYVQLGSGSTSRLHKNLVDATADGSGNVSLDIWPGLRTNYANNDPVVTRNTAGLWRMTSNTMPWDVGEAVIYGIDFEAGEAL